MSEIEVRLFTKPEAELATNQFIASGVQMRHMLLDLYERRAHTALGFADDFEMYAEKRLGVSWKPEYLRVLRLWARVERDTVSMDDPRNALTQAVAVELNRLPPAERAEAYKESLILKGVGKNPLRDIKHIVNRRLGVTDKYKGNKRVDEPALPANEPDIPIGALVDVHTGRPVEDEPAQPAAPVATVQAAPKPTVSTFTPAPDPEPVEEPEVSIDEPVYDVPQAFVMSDAIQKKVHAFQAYYAASGRDLSLWQTVEEIVSQLYTIKKDRLAKYE